MNSDGSSTCEGGGRERAPEVIHLSYAIAQFFAIMLGSILRTVGGAIAIAALLLLSVVGVIALARTMARRRRR